MWDLIACSRDQLPQFSSRPVGAIVAAVVLRWRRPETSVCGGLFVAQDDNSMFYVICYTSSGFAGTQVGQGD